MMRKLLIAILSLCYCFAAAAQDALKPEQYIALYKDMAIREMKRVGVPAAITLAQGLLETENGNSVLVKKSNNHFGIKCKSGWTAASVRHDDDAIGECFRSYRTAEESYRDHSDFLRNNQRYGSLFTLDVKDYKGWAYGLKRAGYATNPAYPQILIKHIEKYNLQQYTLQAADEAESFDAPKPEVDAATPPNVDVIAASIDNVLTINGSKCVYAAAGTSMLAIATKHDVVLAKLLSFNELSEDGLLQANQYVYLEKKSKTGNTDFYTATGTETLYDIAQKNGIQLQPMLDYNKLWGNEDIAAGVKIFLKPGLKQTTVVTAAAPAKLHTVQAKEGLYGIAKKYNVTVQQLRQWNGLESDALRIGQQLKVNE
jgi:LysM repeat protein